MKKLIVYGTLVAASITLIGCGGSSNASSTAPSNTKATVQVTNSSPFNYASAIIVRDSDGVVIHDQKLDCAAGKDNCYVYYTGSEIKDSVNIYFKDDSGRKVRYTNFPGILPQYSSVDPKNYESGLYLAGYIVKNYQTQADFDWIDTNIRLDNFFKNYDSADQVNDNFEELGSYYEYKLKTTSLDDREIIAQLVSRLANWDVATKAELQPLYMAKPSITTSILAWYKSNFEGERGNLIPNAHAQIANCSSGLSGFLSFASDIVSFVPVAGDAIEAGMNIGNKLCDGTEDTLAQILELVRTLQQSMDKVGLGVSTLLANQLDKDIAKKYNEIAIFAGQSSTYPQDLTNLSFIQSQYTAVKKGHASLEALFKANGGWRKTFDEGGENLKSFLLLAQKQDGILSKLNNAATYDNANYYKYFRDRCAGLMQSRPNENFIDVRAKCNNILNANVAYILATQKALQPVVSDIYTVLSTYQDEIYENGKASKVKDNFNLLYGAQALSGVPGAIKTKFDADLNTMVADIKSTVGGAGYFKAYEGINADLMTQMVAKDCNWTGRGRDKAPAIRGWYAPNTNSKDNYLVTECRNGTNLVKARYYYEDQGSVADAKKVSNVLGVLIAEAYTSKNGYYQYNNTSSSDSYVLKKFTNLTTNPSDPNVTVTGGNGEYARWTQDTPTVKTAGRGPNSAIDGVWGEGYSGKFEFNNIKYSCNFGASCKYNYNWLSFKDSDGFNYVIYYWAGGAWQGTNNPAGSATGMSCMTYDCEMVDGSTKVKFKEMKASVDLR